MKFFYLSTISYVIAASGCASIEPALKSSASPNPSSSYVSGSFTRKDSGGFAFAITNLQTNREYGLSLGEDSALPSDVESQVITIQVPPGRYMVSSWYTYGTLNKAKNDTNKITNPYLARPFELKPNTVLYLGKFAVSTTHQSSTTIWAIKPERVTLNQAHNAFVAAQPMFNELVFSCHLCID